MYCITEAVSAYYKRFLSNTPFTAVNNTSGLHFTIWPLAAYYQ